MPSKVHAYDGIEHRFAHTDVDASRRAEGLAHVADMLGMASSEGAFYALFFYSGGTGVFDLHRIAFPCAPADALAMALRLGYADVEQIAVDDPWRGDLERLVGDEDDASTSLLAASIAFIEEQRADFQPRAAQGATVWFARDSDVNCWSLIYAHDGALGFMSLDQG